MKSNQTLRASVSFPPGVYEAIKQLAQRKKVSVAWVIREAAEKYILDQCQLLEKTE